MNSEKDINILQRPCLTILVSPCTLIGDPTADKSGGKIGQSASDMSYQVYVRHHAACNRAIYRPILITVESHMYV